MDTIALGMTGLKVSPIAFGTWQLGGEWGEFDEQQAVAAIRQARELGVNLFDAAQGYGFGASEQLLGRALREDLDKRRDEVVIATKGGLRMTGDGLVRDTSPDFLRRGVEDSLRSLGVDYIDIYQVHWRASVRTAPDRRLKPRRRHPCSACRSQCLPQGRELTPGALGIPAGQVLPPNTPPSQRMAESYECRVFIAVGDRYSLPGRRDPERCTETGDDRPADGD